MRCRVCGHRKESDLYNPHERQPILPQYVRQCRDSAACLARLHDPKLHQAAEFILEQQRRRAELAKIIGPFTATGFVQASGSERAEANAEAAYDELRGVA